MPRRTPATYLLWRKHPLPKWHCQMLHPRPLRERTQAATTRQGSMARCGALRAVALHTAQHRAPPQQPSSAGGWHIEARTLQLDLCWCYYETHAHLWLPCVCFAECASFGETTTTMVTSCAPWAQPRPKPNACKERVLGTQLNYRVCLTAISLLLRQLFQDYTSQRTRCQ